MLDTLKKITMSCRKVFIRSFYKSGSSRLEACRDDNFLLNSTVRGFTLIELLVVVLIIGILASVALPQYQVAVLKARYQEMVIWGTKIREALQIYYLANGEYTTDFSALDLDFGTSSSSTNDSGGFTNIYPSKFTHCWLRDYYPGSVICEFRTGKYIGFSTSAQSGNRLCLSSPTDKQTQQVCQSVTGNASPSKYNTYWSYTYL